MNGNAIDVTGPDPGAPIDVDGTGTTPVSDDGACEVSCLHGEETLVSETLEGTDVSCVGIACVSPLLDVRVRFLVRAYSSIQGLRGDDDLELSGSGCGS